MIVIGELINSTRDEVLIAIEDRDADTIKNLALRQAEAGVDCIDVNAGAFVDDEFEHLAWTIETVRSVTDLPLALDSADPEVIEKALEISGPAMINSITAETEKLERIIPLAKKYHAKLIALCLDDNGMPTTAEDRIRIADKFAQAFEEAQIPLEDVFLDPLVKPVSVNEQFGNEVLATLDEINRRYPGFISWSVKRHRKMDVMAKAATATGIASASPTITPTALDTPQLVMQSRFTSVACSPDQDPFWNSSRFTPKLSSVTVAANRKVSHLRAFSK